MMSCDDADKNTFSVSRSLVSPLTFWLSVNHLKSLKEVTLLPPALSNKPQVSKTQKMLYATRESFFENNLWQHKMFNVTQ